MATVTDLTTYTAGPEDIEHMVALVFHARPTWEPGLIRLVLSDLSRQVSAPDLAVAALRAAQNPDLRNPKAIGWRGPHWDGARTKPVDVVPRERCSTCGKTERQCVFERPGVDDDHEFVPRRTG